MNELFYLVTLQGNGHNKQYILCRSYNQYRKKEGDVSALFHYVEYITVKKPIKSFSEASLIYDLVPSNSSLCAGESIEPILEITSGHREFIRSNLKEGTIAIK